MRKVWACAIGAVVSAMCAGVSIVNLFSTSAWNTIWDMVIVGLSAVMFVGLSGGLLALGLEKYLDEYDAEDEDEEDE